MAKASAEKAAEKATVEVEVKFKANVTLGLPNGDRKEFKIGDEELLEESVAEDLIESGLCEEV